MLKRGKEFAGFAITDAEIDAESPNHLITK
jgi:hypothetical protein